MLQVSEYYFEIRRRIGATLHVRVDGRVKRIDIARIVCVFDVALAGVILLVTVELRTSSRWSGIGACGAGAVRRSVRSGACWRV